MGSSSLTRDQAQGPLHWEHRVLATGLPGKSRNSQFSSVTQSCPTLCNPMNRSTPSLSVHHQLPEFTQTHVHRVGDAIQPSHPLLSLSPPAPNPSSIYTFLVTLNLKVLMEGRQECVFWKNFPQFVVIHTLEGMMLKLKLQYFGHLM